MTFCCVAACSWCRGVKTGLWTPKLLGLFSGRDLKVSSRSVTSDPRLKLYIKFASLCNHTQRTAMHSSSFFIVPNTAIRSNPFFLYRRMHVLASIYLYTRIHKITVTPSASYSTHCRSQQHILSHMDLSCIDQGAPLKVMERPGLKVMERPPLKVMSALAVPGRSITFNGLLHLDSY